MKEGRIALMDENKKMGEIYSSKLVTAS